jgi:tetratricopeptide (TPR) repeat protein
MTALTHQLTTLESYGLIRLISANPELEYLFRHALVQEAAYSSLVKQDRKQLHRIVGERLEQLYPDRVNEFAPMLAQHFQQADEPDRALKYYRLAADAAYDRYANGEAASHYAQAIDLAQKLERDRVAIGYLYQRCGRAYELSAQDGRALQVYEALEQLARTRGDRSLELQALIARETIYVKPSAWHDADQARGLAEQGLALAHELNDRAAEAKIHWHLMLLHKFTDQFAIALQHGDEALRLARELSLRELTAYVLNDIYGLYMLLGSTPKALAALAEAQQLWRELGPLNMLADNLAGMANIHIMIGEYDRALDLSREATVLSDRVHNIWNQSYSRYMIDMVYLERGEYERAIQIARECIALAEQAGFIPGMVQTRCELAFIYSLLGAYRQATGCLDEARAKAGHLFLEIVPLLDVFAAHVKIMQGNAGEAARLLAEVPDQNSNMVIAESAFYVELVRSLVALAQQDFEQTLSITDQAMTMLRRFGIRLFLPDLLLVRGQALLAQHQTLEAERVLNEARHEAEVIGSRRSLWPILMAKSQLEGQRGSIAAAQQLHQQAREIVESIASQIHTPELRESFLQQPEVRAVRETE